MDPRFGGMEWTAAELEEARSIVARLSNAYDSGATVAGAGNGNGDTRHDRIVRELQAWFPWRTMPQLIELYIDLMAEMAPQAEPQPQYDAGAVVDPTFDFMNDDNFVGMPPVQQADHAMNNVVVDAAMNYYGGVAGGGMVFGGAPMGETVEQAAPPAPVPVPVPVVMNRNDDEVMINQGGGRHRAAPTNTTGRFWTTEEHRLFLKGLRVYGRGDWKNISKFFVTTKTPVQVSSHAQKYYRRVESAAGNKQRYSINDVGLNDADDAAMDDTNNNFGGWQTLAFAGGHLEPISGGAAGHVIAPASSSAAAMNSVAQFWAPLLYNPQMQQQFMQIQAQAQTQQSWNDQHMMMAAGGAVTPMEGATDNFESAGAANYYYQQQQQEEEGCAYGVPADQWMMNQNNNMF